MTRDTSERGDSGDTMEADTPDSTVVDTSHRPDTGVVPPPTGKIKTCKPVPSRVIAPPTPSGSTEKEYTGGLIASGANHRVYTLQIAKTPARDQFRVWDVADPSDPVFLGSHHFRQSPMSLEARGRFAFVLQLTTNKKSEFTYRIHALDTQAAGGPARLSSIDMVDKVGGACSQGWNGGRRGKMALIGSNIYLLCSNKIAVVDFSNPCKPRARLAKWVSQGDLRSIIGWKTASGGFHGVVETDSIGGPDGLELVRLDRRVRTIKSVRLKKGTRITFDAAVSGNRLYGLGADGSNPQLTVTDIRPSRGLKLLGRVGLSGAPGRIGVKGDTVVSGKTYDMTNPMSPKVISLPKSYGVFGWAGQ